MLLRLDIIYSEPGYYEAGQFGIRLENIVMVKNASTKVNLFRVQMQKVNVSKDNDMAHSEGNCQSKNQVEKKTEFTIRH